MSTLRELWQAVFPTARVLARPPEREVGWVRVLKSRVPAFDALEAADLAILPMSALRELSASGEVEASSVVDAVARAAGSGVLVVGASAGEPLATEALERASALGLGAFRLGEAEPQALERSVIGYLVNGRAELERQARVLESILERLALEGRDLAAHTAAIASFLGRAVALERPRGRPLAIHAPADVDTAAAAAAAYIAQPRRTALRVRLPDPAGDAGALVLLGPSPPTELERVAAERVAALLALEMRRGALTLDAPEASRSATHHLPSEGPPWVSLVSRQLHLDRPSSVEERDQLRAEIRRLELGRRLALRGDAGSLELRIVAVADEQDPLGLDIAARVASLSRRPVAVSRPYAETEQRALAEAEARATLEAVEALRPDELARAGPADQDLIVCRADRLAAYRLLAAVHDVPDGQRQARILLGPLLEGRSARVQERLDTLRAVLDGAGAADAAAALGVHRNTLAYRLSRIEERTGWNMDDPSLRFALGLALRMVQHAQGRTTQEPSLSGNALRAER
ncbi:MAG: helix-turn-helix domain-containing protein [Chloroflexi bacterium]|nr:helix-turn-helix domain-containing protein [Chloroflexota bacterium]